MCIGLLVADILVKPVSRKIFEIDATQVDEICIMPGGDALNESIILSRLGLKSNLGGKVGKDAFGEMIIKEVEKNGVNVDNIKVDTNTVTAASIVLIDKEGGRNFVYSKGNNDSLSIHDLNLEAVRKYY